MYKRFWIFLGIIGYSFSANCMKSTDQPPRTLRAQSISKDKSFAVGSLDVTDSPRGEFIATEPFSCRNSPSDNKESAQQNDFSESDYRGGDTENSNNSEQSVKSSSSEHSDSEEGAAAALIAAARAAGYFSRPISAINAVETSRIGQSHQINRRSRSNSLSNEQKNTELLAANVSANTKEIAVDN